MSRAGHQPRRTARVGFAGQWGVAQLGKRGDHPVPLALMSSTMASIRACARAATAAARVERREVVRAVVRAAARRSRQGRRRGSRAALRRTRMSLLIVRDTSSRGRPSSRVSGVTVRELRVRLVDEQDARASYGGDDRIQTQGRTGRATGRAEEHDIRRSCSMAATTVSGDSS